MTDSENNNVVSLLLKAATNYPKRPAIIRDKPKGGVESVSFGELWQRIDSVSSGLHDVGLKQTERVVIMVPMSIELYILLLAVLKNGAVAVFVDPWISLRQIADFCVFSKPKGFIGIPKSHLLRLLNPKLFSIPLTVSTGGSLSRFMARHTLSQLESLNSNFTIQAVSPETPALITFTSGSSGVPKGANRTHGFLMAQHKALQQEFLYLDNDVDMPMFPVFALNNLARGITSVIPSIDFKKVSTTNGQVIAKQMVNSGITTCTASPTFFDRLCESAKDTLNSRPALRRILTGGAPVSDEQLSLWEGTFPETDIVVVYGSTEAEPVAHIGAQTRFQKTQGVSDKKGYFVGKPSCLVKTKVIGITNEKVVLNKGLWDGYELSSGSIGELIVSGEHVCRDYFNNKEATAENKIVDGDGVVWHRMGDTGYFDDEGNFWLAGRVHSTIIRNGEFIHPQIIEKVAKAIEPSIPRLAVIGIKDQKLGEKVVLAIEGNINIEIITGLKDTLKQDGFVIDEVCSVPGVIPLDPRHNSKVDYTKLRKVLREM